MFPKRNFAINKYIVMESDNDINIINRYGKLLSFWKKTDNNKMTNVVFIADDVLDFILTK